MSFVRSYFFQKCKYGKAVFCNGHRSQRLVLLMCSSSRCNGDIFRSGGKISGFLEKGGENCTIGTAAVHRVEVRGLDISLTLRRGKYHCNYEHFVPL